MRLKYAIPDHIDDEPIVPDDLRRELEQRWVGCYSITVCRVMPDESEPSLNSISLVCKKEHDTPNEDSDEVGVAILRIMLAHAHEAQAEMPGGGRVPFRVYCYRRTDSKTSRKKSRFNYVIQLDAEGGYEDSSSYMTPAELEQMRMQMQLESEQQRNDTLVAVISSDRDWMDKLLGRVLEMSNLNNQAIEPLQKLMAYMGSVALAGWQTSYQNLQQMFDAKQVDAEMKYKTKRTSMLLRTLAPVLLKGKQQFEAHMAKKANGAAPGFLETLMDAAGGDDEEGGDDTEVADVQASSGVRMQSSVASTPQQEEGAGIEDLPEAEQSDPLAATARYCGELIRSDQWFQIMEELRKPELKLLRAVFNSETDEDFFAAWDSLSKRMDKIAPLWAILDESQQETLTQLQEAVDTVRAES